MQFICQVGNKTTAQKKKAKTFQHFIDNKAAKKIEYVSSIVFVVSNFEQVTTV